MVCMVFPPFLEVVKCARGRIIIIVVFRRRSEKIRKVGEVGLMRSLEGTRL